VRRARQRRALRPARPPSPPREPLPEECCGKGCTPCVFDRYAEEMERYRAALEAWRKTAGER